jgi:hypothetical protein
VSHLLEKGTLIGQASDKGIVINVARIMALLVANIGLTYWNTHRLNPDPTWVAHKLEVLT